MYKKRALIHVIWRLVIHLRWWYQGGCNSLKQNGIVKADKYLRYFMWA